jgi:hypothetical protein
MTDDRKRKSLTILGLTAIAIMLIAAALPRLELKLGTPLPGWQEQSEALPAESMTFPPITINTFIRAILGIILVMVVAYIVYKVIRGASWKEILSSARYVAILGVMILVGIGILFAIGSLRITTLLDVPEILPPALKLNGPQLAPLNPGMIWLVWIGLCMVIVLLAVRIARWQIQRRRARDPLTLEVERALQALRSGESFKNVIVRCYREMSLVLKKERSIELEDTMTAQEFERLLEARGIPRPPIEQLTRLFEAARYGYRSPTSADEQEAFDCLNAIVQYVREHGKLHRDD